MVYSRVLLPVREPPNRVLIIVAVVLISTGFTACGDRGGKGGAPAKGANAAATSTPSVSGVVAPILLFKGTGTSPNDVTAFETILNSNHFNYATVDSSRLNGMSESQIGQHRLLIVPGGNFVDIGNSLTSSTTANIRSGVQHGLTYLGICAGAFFGGNSPYNGLNLTSGVRFGFYAAENRGIHKTAVAIAAAGTPTLDQ